MKNWKSKWRRTQAKLQKVFKFLKAVSLCVSGCRVLEKSLHQKGQSWVSSASSGWETQTWCSSGALSFREQAWVLGRKTMPPIVASSLYSKPIPTTCKEWWERLDLWEVNLNVKRMWRIAVSSDIWSENWQNVCSHWRCTMIEQNTQYELTCSSSDIHE